MVEPIIRPEIFKAYDIRGIVDDALTPESVGLIGRAIGSLALERGNTSIVVGRDGRLSGPELSAALAKGLMATGINVIDIGMVPTPIVYFATDYLKTGASVSITGSHNPPEYNGFKIMAGGETLSGNAIQGLHQNILSNTLRSGQGHYTSQNIVDAYLDYIRDDITLKKPFRVVIDCGNGVAGSVAPQLYRRLGCEVIELFTDVDGTFPNHHPDPIDEKNLVDLKRTVHTENADFGLAFDGDGDRLGVVTSSGKTIWPDRQMILFAQDILTRQPGAEIIFDVKCSRLLSSAISQAGGRATMYKTGHSFIKGKLKESGAALAGEMSGHIFFKERWFGFDDGLYAGARLCELLSGFDQPASEVLDTIPDSLITPELRLELNEGEQHQLIRELVRGAKFEGGTIHTIDGLRVDFEDGFGLARASNTTPTVILRFEADNIQTMDRIQQSFRSLFNHTRPDLELPF